MKLTKFAQSCVLIETKGKRILIDPGNIQYGDSLLKKAWSDIDVLLVTHHHGDHCFDEAIKDILKNKKTKFYTTKEVLEHHTELSANLIKEGDIVNSGSVEIEVVKAVHGWIPLFKGDNKAVHENVAFIIDDGEKRIYHTSDTIGFNNDYKCDVICAPISGRGVVMEPRIAAQLMKMVSANILIPVHTESPKYPIDWDYVKKEMAIHEVKPTILGIGESIEF